MINEKKWYEEYSQRSDIILASTVSISRNFYNFPFMRKIEKRDANKVVVAVSSHIKNNEKYRLKTTEEMSNLDKTRLFEELLCTENFLDSSVPGAIIEGENNLLVVINEDEHINIRCNKWGVDIETAYEECSKFEKISAFQRRYAFCDEFGYLTGNLRNTGTGLHVGVILNIPAIILTKKADELISMVHASGMNIKRTFGKGDVRWSDIITIENSETLGVTEENILESVFEAAKNVAKLEAECEKQFVKQNSKKNEDTLWRAYGILKYAREVSYPEAIRYLSEVNLGVRTGIINEVGPFNILQYAIETEYAALCQSANKLFKIDEENVERANYLREKFK